jgi:hypothetical protein
MYLEIYLADGCQMELKNKNLEVAFVLWYPADNDEIAEEVTNKAPLFIEALEDESFNLVKKIVKGKEEINPLETITGYLEDLDASVSEILLKQQGYRNLEKRLKVA